MTIISVSEFIDIISDILKEDIVQDIILKKRRTYGVIKNTKIMRTMALEIFPELAKKKVLMDVIYSRNSVFNNTDQNIMVKVEFKLDYNSLFITFNSQSNIQT